MQLKLECESADCYINHLLETQICKSDICNRKERMRESLHTTSCKRLPTVRAEKKISHPHSLSETQNLMHFESQYKIKPQNEITVKISYGSNAFLKHPACK